MPIFLLPKNTQNDVAENRKGQSKPVVLNLFGPWTILFKPLCYADTPWRTSRTCFAQGYNFQENFIKDLRNSLRNTRNVKNHWSKRIEADPTLQGLLPTTKNYIGLGLKTIATAISVHCLFALLHSKFTEKAFLGNLVSVHPTIDYYILMKYRLYTSKK